MGFIDKTGQGNTLLILTDAESRLIRRHLEASAEYFESGHCQQVVQAFNRGIARGTAKMSEESKAEWKGRQK